jgi:hypothetical protein
MTAVATESGAARTAPKAAWLWFLLGLFVLMIGLMVGPRVPDDQQAAHCVVNVHLPGPFGFSLNCDSPDFLKDANTPSLLLDPTSIRQSRPGLILAAALIARPIMPLVSFPSLLGVKAQRSDIDPSRIGQALTEQFPAYAAYVLLNVLLLCATFYCVLRIVALNSYNAPDALPFALLASLGLLVVANDVTKAYFWTPHTQMFNIFIPVFGVYAFVRALGGAFGDRGFAFTTGLITGLGFVSYPTFIVLIACVPFAGLLAMVFAKAPPARSLVNMAVYVVFAIAPIALWYLFVRIKSGEVHSVELESPTHMWMPRVFAADGAHGLIMFFYDRLLVCLRLAASQALPVLMTLAILAAIAVRYSAVAWSALRQNGLLVFSALFITAALGGAYSLSGDMHFRWAQALIPPLLVATGVLIIAAYRMLPHPAQRALTAALALAAIVEIAFTIIKNGPFS